MQPTYIRIAIFCHIPDLQGSFAVAVPLRGFSKDGFTMGQMYLGNCTVIIQSMDRTCNESKQLFVGKGLGVDHAADTNGGDEDMKLLKFTGLRVYQKLRLVADPVNVHTLSGNPFHRHTQRIGTIVGINTY